MWFILMTSPHFTLITVIWGSKIEIRIWNLACELLSCVSYTYNTVFWKVWKFWILEHFPEKLDFGNFGGQNPKKRKIRDGHLVENSISFVLTPFVCDLLQHTLTRDLMGGPFGPPLMVFSSITQIRLGIALWNFQYLSGHQFYASSEKILPEVTQGQKL